MFVFANDGSRDTIEDFARGDKIDLRGIAGVDKTDVKFDGKTDTLWINTDNDAQFEMSIIVHGADVNITRDVLFG